MMKRVAAFALLAFGLVAGTALASVEDEISEKCFCLFKSSKRGYRSDSDQLDKVH